MGTITGPLNVGSFVGQYYNPGSPYQQGNFIVGANGLVDPFTELHWVVINASGIVTEYTLLNPPC